MTWAFKSFSVQIEHSMEPPKGQIEPALVQAIIAQATANGLSVNDYLARLLGSTLRYNDELSPVEVHQDTETRALAFRQA
jgi:hypothetical protein